jgi:DNA-binding CsgD family transcriptional regulator
MEKRITANIKQLILPDLSKLKKSRLKASHMSHVNNIESHLYAIFSPFAEKLSSGYLSFTPLEIRVSSLIKEGMSTKEVAGLLHCSESVIIFHRHNIRKKLGLIYNKINLRSHLQSLQ